MSPEEAWHTMFSNFDHSSTGRQKLHLPLLDRSTLHRSANRPLPSIYLKKLSPLQYSCFFFDGHIIIGDEEYIKTHATRYLNFANQHDLSDSRISFEYPLPLEKELDKINDVDNRAQLRRYHRSWIAQENYRKKLKQQRQQERWIMGPGGCLRDDSHGRCAVCSLRL